MTQMTQPDLRCKLRCELHCHTVHSHDGYTTLAELREECVRRGIDVVAVTDHDRLVLDERDCERFDASGIQLIPGCEVTAESGVHLIGLFLADCVEPGAELEVVQRIKSQGGLVVIPHPYRENTGLLAVRDPYSEEVEEVLASADLIEVLNAKGWDSGQTDHIRQVAQRFNMGVIVGSDAHRPWEVGTVLSEYLSDSLQIDQNVLIGSSFDIIVEKRHVPSFQLEPNGGTRKPSLWRRLQTTTLYQRMLTLLSSPTRKMLKMKAYRIRRLLYRRLRKDRATYVRAGERTRGQ